MNLRIILLSILLFVFSLSSVYALTPREAAMQSAFGGWGDVGDVQIVTSPNNGGPYSMKIHWKDSPSSDTPFWFLGWYTTAKGYDKLSFDLFVESNNGKATMPIYLTEPDGDRWVAQTNVTPENIGKWQHFEVTKDQFSFWALGNNARDWDSISSIVVEPAGKEGDLTLYIDNLILSGTEGKRDLLDPANLPRSYTEIPKSQNPLNSTNPKGHIIIAGGSNFWTNSSSLEKLCALSPSIGISSGAFPGYEKNGVISKRTAALNRPLMQEHQDGLDFEVELTQEGAWCVRWDGESNNTTPGKFDKGHTACSSHPKFIEMNKRRVDAIIASGINTLTLVDYVWPYMGGRWGYSEADIAAYRRAMTGTDGGLKLIDKSGTHTISFWDYFKDYSGFILKPADLGYKSWNEYQPTTEEQAWADNGQKRKNMFLFVTLNHYQWLKFLQEIGLYIESKGGHLWMIPNPEDLGDAADYIYAGHLAGLQCNLPEYFGNPIWTEAIYRSGNYLSKNVREGSHLVGPILETNAGGHGTPYYDAEVSYAVAYDLFASMSADVSKNDFLDEAPYDVMSDPKNTYYFDRFRDTMSKVYAFDQYKSDKPSRKATKIAVITSRNINRYRGDLFYGFGATDKTYDGCLADALAKEGMSFNLMDTIGYAPIEEQQVIFWGVPEAPETSVPRIKKWLDGNPSRALICHSYQPTRRISGLGYCPWITKQDFIENPLGGKDWGLPVISKKDDFTSGKIDTVKAPFIGVFKQGEQITLPGGLYIAKGGKVLLSVSGYPLVSEFKRPNGSKVIYLHYRAGEPDTSELDRRIASALASYYGARRLADSVDNIMVHSYTIKNGSAHVLWNRDVINKWEFIYDGNRKQRLTYSNPGIDAIVKILVPQKGEYVVYEVLSGVSSRVKVVGNVELSLKDKTCAVYYVLPVNAETDKRLAALKSAPIHKLLSADK
ncbi:MAG: hypothetical protein ACYC27_00650 [Armatimonadota bacterium]